MRGPKLVGYEPRAVRWAGNSQRVYFEWKRPTDPLLREFDTYVVNRDGSGLRKLDKGDGKLTPPASPDDTTPDKRLSLYTVEGDLYLYDHAADKARLLTRTMDAESTPRFLRDGKRIAFTRNSNLFVMDLDGSSLTQMTDIRTPSAPGAPAEKKGTESQQYLEKQEKDLFEIVKDRARLKEEKKKENPREPLRLTATGTITPSISGLVLSPDEKTVLAGVLEQPKDAKTVMVPNFITESAYTEQITARTNVGDLQSRGRLAFINVETGKATYLDTGLKRPAAPAKTTDTSAAQRTEAPPPPQDRDVRLLRPTWSEDGKKVFITATSTDNKDWWLLAVDPDTAKARTITTVHDDAWVNARGTPGWMPDNQHIYFLSERDGYAHLYTADFDTGEAKQLTSGRWEVFDAKLSGDKKQFYIETNEAHFGERHVYSMDLNGGDRRRLTEQPGRHTADVSPDDRSIALISSYVNRPPELFVRAIDKEAAPVKVTDSPLEEFRSYPWQDAPIVSIPARDGVGVPGRLYKPRTPRQGGPAVIFVHGAGYLQNIHRGWSNYYREYMFHHILTERGYTVLDIDYRGSAGYGRDWRTAIYRHMGGTDLDDHVDAAKWLISTQGVDPKRIGIYGGSYGGFITLMAMFKHADLFAAGAALRPVTDWAHYNHGYTSNILNIPQEDAEAYKRSSPIYFAEGLKGALLMCHGMVDVNVHAQDTVRLAQKLIELRKENWEMALYPVEDHAFVQPTSWADEYKRILKLFEMNLRPRASTPPARSGRSEP